MSYQQRPIESLCEPGDRNPVARQPVYVAPWTCATNGAAAAGILADGPSPNMGDANGAFLCWYAEAEPPDDAMVTTVEHLVSWMGFDAEPTREVCPECQGKPCPRCNGEGEVECCECWNFSDCPECDGRRCKCDGDGYTVVQPKPRIANLLGVAVTRGLVARAVAVLPAGEVRAWSTGELEPVHFRHAKGWAVVMPRRDDLDGAPVYEPEAAG